MAAKSSTRRWILIVLVAVGVIVVAMLPRAATDDMEPSSDAPTGVPAVPGNVADQDADTGKATKRVLEDCDPVAEALKYEELVDTKALAVLRWNNMSDRAAKLKIPVYVHSVDDGAVVVGILPIPMRAQYLNIWMNSGHIERGPGDTFLLDPCASWIEAWEEMDQAARAE